LVTKLPTLMILQQPIEKYLKNTSTLATLAFLLFLFCLSFDSYADRSKKALKLLAEGDLAKVEALLTKDLEKDSSNFATYYVLSKLHIAKGFHQFSVDQSLAYLRQSKLLFDREESKVKSKKAKIGIDSASMRLQKHKVDSLAFAQALVKNTIAAYDHFLILYYDAEQIPVATSLRNELAYELATNANSWQAYEYFMLTYPTSDQYADAKAKYERLIFEDKTKSQNLKEYRRFLVEFPDTPYRNVAEKAILEIATVSNHPDEYLAYLREFPYSVWRPLVYNLIYFADREFFGSKYFTLTFRQGPERDSILYVQQLNSSIVFPIWDTDGFGLMSKNVGVVVKPKFEAIDPEWLCGNISDQYLLVENGGLSTLINRAGAAIFSGKIDSVTEIGGGILMVTEKNKNEVKLILLSGNVLFSGIFDNAKLLKGSLLAMERDGKQALFTILGKKLTGHLYDDISVIGSVLVFNFRDQFAIVKLEETFQWADAKKPNLKFEYEDVLPIKEQYILVANGDNEGLFDFNLNPIVPIGKHRILPLKKGWQVVSAKGQQLVWDSLPQLGKYYKQVLGSSNWYATRDSTAWTLRQTNGAKVLVGLDSVVLIGENAAYVEIGKDQKLVFPQTEDISLRSESAVSILGASRAGKAIAEYYLIKEKDRCMVVSPSGKPLFAEKVDNVSYLMPGYFETTYRGMKGIVDSLGRFALETKYQAVGAIGGGKAMILNEGSFGLIDLPRKRLIGTSYQERLLVYNDDLLIAKQGGKLGLISQDKARKMLNFSYDAIEYWTDSVALVREKEIWSLQKIYGGRSPMSAIKSYDLISQESSAKAIKILTDQGYNILHTSKGLLFLDYYLDIVNLGTQALPIYFTERYDATLQKYEIKYWDGSGKVLRAQFFTDKSYSVLYCDE
jgi:hypothetical protein